MTTQLEADYAHCRALAGRHGKTYYLATRLLPPERRPAIHALYGFARYADDLVDEPTGDPTVALQTVAADLAAAHPARPETRAVRDVIARYELDPALFEAFLDSMRMDLTVTSYADAEDLERYVYGSAAVIGLMVLPVLGTVGPREAAAPYAADLGRAFQLTNFVRDVAEDLDRGRVYLPADGMTRHGVTRHLLERRRATDAVRSWLADEVARVRGVYARAEPGIELLDPVSRPCVRAAFVLYGEILDAVEANGYDVFSRRATVPRRRRLRVAGALAARSVAGRALAGRAPGGRARPSS